MTRSIFQQHLVFLYLCLLNILVLMFTGVQGVSFPEHRLLRKVLLRDQLT